MGVDIANDDREPIRFEDTLVLPRGGGFPPAIDLGGTYRFDVAGRRVYNMSPSRAFLVEEIDGSWNFVGHAQVRLQWIDTETDRTLGEYEVTLIYPREYAMRMNATEAPEGLGYVGP